jgi:hydroxyacylglutathione hydrolase
MTNLRLHMLATTIIPWILLSGLGACGKRAPSNRPAHDQTETTSDRAPSDTPAQGICPAASAAFPARWQSGGPACPDEPAFQVHAYDANTFILRQSLCTHFEAPFLYLLFGRDRVLLEDTGAGEAPVVDAVSQVIRDWLAAHGRDSIELVVVNSHAHDDHTAGNAAFRQQPGTRVVGTTPAEISAFFGIAAWPTGMAAFDLGDRVVDIIPIPGHEASHIAIYDRNTGLLLTGDTVYPGRLYVRDLPAYVTSIERLVGFTEGKRVCSVLGTHIEMTSVPGTDYAFDVTHHPDEHELQLGRVHLVELRDAVRAMNGVPTRQVHDDFIIYPVP